jgi:hypothetical protein
MKNFTETIKTKPRKEAIDAIFAMLNQRNEDACWSKNGHKAFFELHLRLEGERSLYVNLYRETSQSHPVYAWRHSVSSADEWDKKEQTRMHEDASQFKTAVVGVVAKCRKAHKEGVNFTLVVK